MGRIIPYIMEKNMFQTTNQMNSGIATAAFNLCVPLSDFSCCCSCWIS